MENTNTNWKVFGVYLLVVLLVMWAGIVKAQIVVTEFNAEWNNANKVEWLEKLSDCDISQVDITKEVKLQQKHKIGEEIKRFQADLSFKMLATRKELQSIINEQIMSDF